MAPSHAAPGGQPGDERLLSGIADAVEKIDGLIPDEASHGNAVPVPMSRSLPWVGVLFVVCCIVLVPWIVYIAVSLPHRALSPNYDVAWAGFDVLLLGALATTAFTVLRRSMWMSTAAGASAALLVTDAWFDTVTSPAGELWQALLLSVVAELPLAVVCLWTARHATDIAERRIEVLLHARGRSGRRRHGRDAASHHG